MEPDRGDTESPGYGVSPPFGGMGLPRGKPYRQTLWENGMSLYAAKDLHTIPHGSPSHDFMRASQKYMREMMCSLPPTAM